MELKITPSGQTIVKPTALGPVANTDSKLLIYGLFQKGRVLAQDEVVICMVTTRPPKTIVKGVTLILTPIIANCVSARHCRES